MPSGANHDGHLYKDSQTNPKANEELVLKNP